MPNVFSSPRKRLRPLKLPPLVEPLGNIVSGAVFVSALLLMAIGVWLMLPFETMQRATPLMRFMAGALPEEIWGLLFLTFGAFQAKVMLWGPVVQRRAAARVALAFLLFLLIVAISEEPYSLLVPIFIILCAAEATALFGFNKRLARHARIEAAITQTLTP